MRVLKQDFSHCYLLRAIAIPCSVDHDFFITSGPGRHINFGKFLPINRGPTPLESVHERKSGKVKQLPTPSTNLRAVFYTMSEFNIHDRK